MCVCVCVFSCAYPACDDLGRCASVYTHTITGTQMHVHRRPHARTLGAYTLTHSGRVHAHVCAHGRVARRRDDEWETYESLLYRPHRDSLDHHLDSHISAGGRGRGGGGGIGTQQSGSEPDQIRPDTMVLVCMCMSGRQRLTRAGGDRPPPPPLSGSLARLLSHMHTHFWRRYMPTHQERLNRVMYDADLSLAPAPGRRECCL